MKNKMIEEIKFFFDEVHSFVIGYDCRKDIYKFEIYNNIFILIEKNLNGFYNIYKIKGYIELCDNKIRVDALLDFDTKLSSTIEVREFAKKLIFDNFDNLFKKELVYFNKNIKDNDLLIKKLIS